MRAALAAASRAGLGRAQPQRWSTAAPARAQLLGPARAAPAPGLGAACRSTASGGEEKSRLALAWEGVFPQVLSKEAITVTAAEADKFNRWAIFPRVFMIQIPTGAVYAWSMWQSPLTASLGVLTPSALDWSLAAVAGTFSGLAVGFGTTMAFLGPWIERAGPRYAALVGGALFGGGHLLSALGCATHTLPLIWLGWGVMGGLGWGLGYVAPIGTLLRWFPDKKGLATGLSIGAFASGGLFAAPMIEWLRKASFRVPDYAGAVGAVEAKTEAGRQFVSLGGEWHEAVLARAADLAKVPGDLGSQLSEGFYLVGTGDTGCAMAFATLGALYSATMIAGAWLMRAPPVGWTPAGFTPPPATSTGLVTAGSVSASMAMRTPQFYLMWLTLAGNASAGVCVIASAKTLMGDIFASVNPEIVTAGFTTAFVGALSVANAGGRVAWSGISDYMGRKNTMFVCSLALPACMLIPQITSMAVGGAYGALPLYAFYGTTFAIVTWYGGVLALIPSYTADLFGTKETGVIYGRLMTGWAVSAIVSPSLLTALRGRSTRQAIDSLVANTPPEAFEKAFQAPVSELPALVDAKTVTIARLMEIAPPGTLDPTPFLYDSTFYAISGILAAAAVSNALITKVDPKFLMVEESAKKKAAEATEEAGDAAASPQGGRAQ